MNKIKCTIETAEITQELQGLKVLVEQRNDDTRAEVANVVRNWGFTSYVGGRHVAVMQDGVRLAIITHPTAPDFN
jgi:hypothetical protein